MGREKIEAERAAKLVELRKKYLDRKGIISKAGTPNKVKLVGRDKVEAERRKKLEELREKYLAKKREVTKSIRPTARKTNTESTKKSDSKLASVVKRQPMPKRGDSKLASVVKKPPMPKRGDSKIASVVKRSSGVVKKKTSIPEGRSINMKVPKKKTSIPEGRSINMKVPKSVSSMSLKEKIKYFNKNAVNPNKIKRGTKKSSAGTFITFPQFTLAEYLKMSEHDRYLVGLPVNANLISKNTKNMVVKVR